MSGYPFEWVPCPPDLEAKKQKLFDEGSSALGGFVAKPWNFYMPKAFQKIYKRIYNFEVRPDDVFVISYPKCGTTWTQEMVWQILNNVDCEKAHQVPLFLRSPMLDIEGVANDDGAEFKEALEMMSKEDPELEKTKQERFDCMYNSVMMAEKMPSPRVIKTHLPLEMLPPNLLDTCKIVFVGRNPKDCCVSYYHHTNLLPYYRFKGTFDDFADLFLQQEYEFGGYWYTLKSCYKRKDHPNMKIIWYEDMKKDLIAIIRDMVQFLGKHLTEYRILKLDDHLYIDNFRKIMTEAQKDPMYEKFIRKGKVGDWRNHFTEEKTKIWDEWIAKNLKEAGIESIRFD